MEDERDNTQEGEEEGGERGERSTEEEDQTQLVIPRQGLEPDWSSSSDEEDDEEEEETDSSNEEESEEEEEMTLESVMTNLNQYWALENWIKHLHADHEIGMWALTRGIEFPSTSPFHSQSDETGRNAEEAVRSLEKYNRGECKTNNCIKRVAALILTLSTRS